MSRPRSAGFRLGVYIFKDAEVVDFAAPYGVFSVARRFDPELDAFLIADATRPVQTQAGLTVLPNYSFHDRPAIDAFLIPGGFGTRQEMHNRRLHEFVQSLPETTLLASVCTGSWVYGRMGLLDGVCATNRKEPDRVEASGFGKVPIDRLAEIAPACRISRARVVDAGRIVTAGGIASGMELGFHLLRRAGYDEGFISEVARVMEYHQAYELYRSDFELATEVARVTRLSDDDGDSDLAISGQVDGRRACGIDETDRNGTGGRSCRASLRSARPGRHRANVSSPPATSRNARHRRRASGGRIAMALA